MQLNPWKNAQNCPITVIHLSIKAIMSHILYAPFVKMPTGHKYYIRYIYVVYFLQFVIKTSFALKLFIFHGDPMHDIKIHTHSS